MTLKHLAFAYVAVHVLLALWCTRRQSLKPLLAALLYQGLALGAVLMVLPFYWMVSTSLKDSGEAMASPPTWLPAVARWGNYTEAWNKPEVGFARYYWVSVYTTALITVGTMLTSIPAAYAFAKMRFPGKALFFAAVLATLMVPGQVLIIPNYIILAKLDWLDSYKALVVPWLASVFSIFLMRQFFMTVPDDLWDASQIDGAGRTRFLWHVLVPLSMPVVVTSGIFNAVNNWNSLLWPLVVTNTPKMRTLMVGLQVFSGESGGDYNLMMAAGTFSIMPVVILFFAMQRFFIEGIARSGMKG